MRSYNRTTADFYYQDTGLMCPKYTWIIMRTLRYAHSVCHVNFIIRYAMHLFVRIF